MINQPKNKKIKGDVFHGELKFNIDFSKVIDSQFLKAQKICDSEVVRLNDNYIRFATGELRRSFQKDTIIGSGEYMSNALYATKDYYNLNVTPSVVRLPLTGGMHFERMKNDHKKDIERALVKGVSW